MKTRDDFKSGTELSQLLDWIESRPELAGLRSAANSAICNYRTDAKTLEERITINSSEVCLRTPNSFHRFLQIIWVPGQNMRGKAYASQSSDASLGSVAKLMSLSTLWDFVTTIPVLSFPLQAATGVLAIPIASGLSFLLLWASNIAGENATNRSHGHKAKASVSLIAFLLLSAAKTAVSGVGTDLVIGLRGIQQGYATKLVSQALELDRSQLDDKRENLFADPLLREQTEKCNENRRQLSQLSRNNPGWQAAYLAEGGQYQDRIATIDQVKRKYGSPANMPACLAVRVLNEDKNLALMLPYQRLQERAEASKMLPALAFLKKYYPDQFSNTFLERDDGSISFRDGTLAVGEATSMFFSKLTDSNQIASLGFSLFTFAVSVTLTGAATVMLYLVSRNKEIKASFSSELESKKASFLGKYRKLANNDDLH